MAKTTRIVDDAGREEVWTEEELDARLNATFHCGRASACEDGAKTARQKAGVLYASGRNDDLAEARIWRDKVAPWLEEIAKVARKRQVECERATYKPKKGK